MVSDWSVFINGLRDLGVVLGFISGFVLLYNFTRQKPVLKYSIECFHKYTQEFNHSILYFDLRIDNVGERGTTLRDMDIKKISPEKYMKNLHTAKGSFFPVLHIAPHNSLKHSVDIKFENVLMKEKEIQIKFKLVHTHDSKVLNTVSKLREWDLSHHYEKE